MSCGARHQLDDSSGSDAGGGIECSACGVRHNAEDVLSKAVGPAQKQEPDLGKTDDRAGAPPPSVKTVSGADQRVVHRAPAFWLSLASLAFALLALDILLMLSWNATGYWGIFGWFKLQIIDQGTALFVIRVLVYLAAGIGLLASLYIAPSLWGLAGVAALLFGVQILAIWFIGDDHIYRGLDAASRNMLVPSARLVAIVVDLFLDVPLFPIFVFFVSAGALQLKGFMGVVGDFVFWPGLLFVFIVVVRLFDIQLSLYTDLPTGSVALAICFSASAVACWRLRT